ncbi:alcohol dehydrogenase catalytic domain-containing protein [Halegenticoccus soli]|uniref:alcohol dehydrogenase catalytic domain-containing protein n=1 Tax=Halegenticoccus soli TaxID=1985678 RepID=UPI0018EDCD60|nr:alcohol dehydrogenase catalytic domain-containing protein [Halegenticoccus soli]
MASQQTGRIACLNGPKSVELKEFAVPSPDPNAVVTEIVRANVCGSEVHIWKGGHPHINEGPPGHEALCRIAELGENVETDNAGQPVAKGDLIVPAYFTTFGRVPGAARANSGSASTPTTTGPRRPRPRRTSTERSPPTTTSPPTSSFTGCPIKSTRLRLRA